MAFYIDGLVLTNSPSISKMQQSKSVNANEHSFHGRDFIEVEITSVKSKELKLSIEICKEDTEVQHIVANVDGLMDRLTPLHLKSDEHILFDGSKEVFVVIKDYNVDWRTGTSANELIATINLSCSIMGTPGNLFAKFSMRSQTRAGDFNGVIAGRSTVGLPYFFNVIPNTTIDALETRLNTLMLDLGNPNNGFTNDTTSSPELDVDVGKVRWRIDTVDNNYEKNAVKVYDDGYTPKLRVISRGHEFLGDMVIEGDQYKAVLSTDDEKIYLYAATGLGTYEGIHFEAIVPALMDSFNITINKDELVRVQLSSGDFFEMERGKEPVYHLLYNTLQFAVENSTNNGDTSGTPTQNWIQTSNDVYISSNYYFDITTGTVTGTSVECDQVFSFAKYAGDFNTSGRFREILKEIS